MKGISDSCGDVSNDWVLPRVLLCKYMGQYRLLILGKTVGLHTDRWMCTLKYMIGACYLQ